jgi:hypothetical protein
MFENASSWQCPQCFRNNFARNLWCLGCNLPRQTEREKDVHVADQINREELEKESTPRTGRPPQRKRSRTCTRREMPL